MQNSHNFPVLCVVDLHLLHLLVVELIERGPVDGVALESLPVDDNIGFVEAERACEAGHEAGKNQ